MQRVVNACCAQALANPAERWICLELLAPPFVSKTKGGKQTTVGNLKKFDEEHARERVPQAANITQASACEYGLTIPA